MYIKICVLTIFLALLNTGLTLDCYECEAVLGAEDNCNKIDSATVLRTCNDPLEFCMEYSYLKPNGQPILERKCSGNDDCGRYNHSGDQFCKNCFLTKCNDYEPEDKLKYKYLSNDV